MRGDEMKWSQTLFHYLQNTRCPTPAKNTSTTIDVADDAPQIEIQGTATATAVSDVDIGLVEDNWKACLAIRDNTLVNKLSDTLAGILGQTPLCAGELEDRFSPGLELNDADWQQDNGSEAKVTQLLTLGVNMALKRCASTFDQQLKVSVEREEREGPSLSTIDMTIFVNDIRRILLRVASPTFMEYICSKLPPDGFKLKWESGGLLLSQVFLKVYGN
ncbi:hypothetical protein AX14_009736 [Amanita brunnescens Koide BX004]|nr:hypothetical protein AX14_009736 [Amanita brunnescens Koide BX004]